MELDAIINDMKVLMAYYDENGACVPVCMEEAVKILEALKVLKEA